MAADLPPEARTAEAPEKEVALTGEQRFPAPLPEAPMPEPRLHELVGRISAQRSEFARLPVADKAALLASCRRRLAELAPDWVRLVCMARGMDHRGPGAAQEWLLGPLPVARRLRRLQEALEAVHRTGLPPLGAAVREAPGGRVAVECFPATLTDALLRPGLQALAWAPRGTDETALRDAAAAFYRERSPADGVGLVIAAGDASGAPILDALEQLFVHGRVCIVKTSPLDDYLVVLWEAVLAPLVKAGYLGFASGGPEAGAYLSTHVRVSHLHVCGSSETHDRVLWGPPGPERDGLYQRNEPRVTRPVTSALGSITPLVVVPGPYSARQRDAVAASIAAQLTLGGGFHVAAPQLLIIPRSWDGREPLLKAIRAELERVPVRRPWYPGAQARQEALSKGLVVERLGVPPATDGPAPDSRLAWALAFGLEAGRNHPLLGVEGYCALLGVVELDGATPEAFLDAATRFLQRETRGSLCAGLYIHPRTQARRRVAAALDTTLEQLPYGVVTINASPAEAWSLCAAPWGGHPSATLRHPASGLGWQYDGTLLGPVEKVVWYGALSQLGRPPWRAHHAASLRAVRRLFDAETEPTAGRVVAGALMARVGG